MGLWDRFRRRPTAPPRPAPRTGPTGEWRAARPMAGVIQRSSIAVGDGLRFRDGLAAWQDHSLGGQLGHAILPSAPAGVMHGVTRYAGEFSWNDELTVAHREVPGPAVQRSVPVRPLGTPLTVARREVTPLRPIRASPVLGAQGQSAAPQRGPNPPESSPAPYLPTSPDDRPLSTVPDIRSHPPATPRPQPTTPDPRPTPPTVPNNRPHPPTTSKPQPTTPNPKPTPPTVPSTASDQPIQPRPPSPAAPKAVVTEPAAPLPAEPSPLLGRQTPPSPVQRRTFEAGATPPPASLLGESSTSLPPPHRETSSTSEAGPIQRRTTEPPEPPATHAAAAQQTPPMVQRKPGTRPLPGMPLTRLPATAVIQREPLPQGPVEPPTIPAVQRAEQAEPDRTTIRREINTPVMPDTAVQRKSETSPLPNRPLTGAAAQRKPRSGAILGEPLAQMPASAVPASNPTPAHTTNPTPPRTPAPALNTVVQRHEPLSRTERPIAALSITTPPPPPTTTTSPTGAPDRTRLPVVTLTRPTVQRRTATAPLIHDRPLITPTHPDRPPTTPRAVPARGTSPAAGPTAAARPAPAPTRTTTGVQRAVVRPTPPADLPTATPNAPIVPAYPPAVMAPPTLTHPTPTVQRAPDKSPTTTKLHPKPPTADKPAPPRAERSDLDDLARRLIDPVSRLLRAELRHGRERSGHLHDHRR